MSSLQAHRDAYARQLVEGTPSGALQERLIAAFAGTPREAFVGAPPWRIVAGSSLSAGATDDPRLLYEDVLVTLASDRGINNGQPSLHARCLAACAPQPGESVLQVGAGTGYYTAILAALVGEAGRVVAYEIEPDLAQQARDNLRHLAQVSVVPASATNGPLSPADVLYVSAGATHPPRTWLDALNPGGRLLFPLTPDEGIGIMLLVTRDQGSRYAASALMRAAFIPCTGARDERRSLALATALHRAPVPALRSLRRHSTPDDSAWLVGNGWWLSTAEPA